MTTPTFIRAGEQLTGLEEAAGDLVLRVELPSRTDAVSDVKAGFLDVANRWRRLAAEIDVWIEAHSTTAGTSERG